MDKQNLKKMEVWRYQQRLLKLLIAVLRFPRLASATLKAASAIMPDEETLWNSGPRHSFSMLGGGLVKADDLAAMRYIYQDYEKHMERLLSPNGRPVVWSEFNLSNELLRVFDVTAYIPEAISIMGHHLGTDLPVRLIEAAENAGLPTEYCSAGKAAIGAYLLGQAPEPDLIISSSHPCDSVVSSYQTLRFLTGKPLFPVDSPYWDDDEAYAYYAQNLWDLVDFLEKNTGQKMDWEALRVVCQSMNEANRHLQEYTEMARAVPSPVNLTCLLLGWQHGIAAMGSANSAVYAKTIRDNAAKRLEKGEGYFKKEKIRVIWYDIPIAFHFMEPWLNKTFGAVTVADFMGRVSQTQIETTSPETMIRDLAKTHLRIAMARQCRGPAEFFTAELARIVEEYSGDCFIFTRHQGCKIAWAMGKLVRDVCARAGKPALFLAVDSFDSRLVGEAAIKKQISDFFYEQGLA